jgi:hypothetical protein
MHYFDCLISLNGPINNSKFHPESFVSNDFCNKIVVTNVITVFVHCCDFCHILFMIFIIGAALTSTEI